VAGREGPTNERIVTLLQKVLDEVKDLRIRQQQLERQLVRLTKATR
jgi:hypothetical protein